MIRYRLLKAFAAFLSNILGALEIPFDILWLCGLCLFVRTNPADYIFGPLANIFYNWYVIGDTKGWE